MWQEQGREPGVVSTPKGGEKEEEKGLPGAQRTAHFWDLGWDSLPLTWPCPHQGLAFSQLVLSKGLSFHSRAGLSLSGCAVG